MRKLMVLILGCVVAMAVACDGGGGESKFRIGVEVLLREWSVMASIEEMPERTIVFKVRNDGTMSHQLLVIKNDLPPDMLPVSGGSIAMSQVKVLESIDPIGPGATGTVRFEATPGKYVLVCNVPGHYQQGMAAGFLVEP